MAHQPSERVDACNHCGQRLKPTSTVIFVIGAPGAGKGTQCAFLTQRFGFNHLSYGDLVRSLRDDPKSVVSRLPTKKGTNNPAVPDDLGAWLIWKEISKKTNATLVDGFPRRVEQLEEYLKLMPPASLTLILDAPQDVSIERVAKRGKMAGDQARPEDLDEDVARKRIQEFHRNSAPVQQALREKGMKTVTVNTDRAEHLIQEELMRIFADL
ncbi:hypothetical protein Daus18300_005005 [Diaporthe australafricana]|uniref:Adenylate kinase n=1 Tax=Diaporthe australafricana TaxID=127596 RepID=A0ABR3X4B8_9PEZI